LTKFWVFVAVITALIVSVAQPIFADTTIVSARTWKTSITTIEVSYNKIAIKCKLIRREALIGRIATALSSALCRIVLLSI